MSDIDNLRVLAGCLSEAIQARFGKYLDEGRTREAIAYLQGAVDSAAIAVSINAEQERFVRGLLFHYSGETV